MLKYFYLVLYLYTTGHNISPSMTKYISVFFFFKEGSRERAFGENSAIWEY